MPINLVSLSFPATLDRETFGERIGREVKGVHPGKLNEEEFQMVESALYEHDMLLFRNVDLTPEQQYRLVKAFDPTSESYGHGNFNVDGTKKSILHSYITSIPRAPQVQLIGHGLVRDHEGIPEITLKHGRHADFHKTRVRIEDEEKGTTRFFRWHMDAALYDLSPPRVTTLYGIKVPKGPMQTVRYDDGTGDELKVTLGTTAFASGKVMFDILPKELKSLAVRARAKYAPHPFEWMRGARAVSTGLGLESDGQETPLDELSAWEEERVKAYPFLWKNPVTGMLYLQVHPCAIREIHIDPLPEGANREGALYPDGAHITDLEEVRNLVYKMLRPGIAPSLVYPHPWEEKDLILFNNRGFIHSVVGVFTKDQIRIFHQCNLAASDEPIGPNEDDVNRWA
ncbi:Clavaminate synthase-like protein, partial [Crucibulum laeve]